MRYFGGGVDDLVGVGVIDVVVVLMWDILFGFVLVLYNVR